MIKRSRLDMVEEMVQTAKDALANIDKTLLSEKAVEIDKKHFISYAGVLDSIVLLGEEVVKSKQAESEEI